MNLYLFVKFVHIFSACVLLGTGGGIAFFMLLAHLSREQRTFVAVSRMVVLADWVFTAPAVIVQFVTGLWLTHKLAIPFGSRWFVTVMALFLFVGLCWLPVVWIQRRLAKMAIEQHGGAKYRRLMNIWIALGIPGFLAVIAILYLMVTKVGIGDAVFA